MAGLGFVAHTETGFAEGQCCLFARNDRYMHSQ